MSITTDAFHAILSTLQIDYPGSHLIVPGQPITVGLMPSLDGLQLPVLLNQIVDATGIAKDLIFDRGNLGLQPEPVNKAANLPPITGPMQIRDLLSTAIPPALLAGIPGVLAQLAASIPLSLQLPVGLRVAWTIKKDGKVADSSTYTVLAGKLGTAGGDDANPTIVDAGSPTIKLSFIPQTTELVVGVLPFATLTLTATVQLFVGAPGGTVDEQSPVVNLPPLTLTVPAIPIPWVVALFRHANFAPVDGEDEGFVLVVVPQSSPIAGLDQLQSVINDTINAVGGLQQVAGFDTLLVGLQSILINLAPQPFKQLRAADQINNLADIQMKDQSISDWQGINANDEISSILCVGPNGYMVDCYNDTDTQTGEGDFLITIGSELAVAMPYLGDLKTTPADRAAIQHNGDSFNDEMSSLKLIRP